MDALEKPMRHPEHYQFFGKKQPSGVLLYGPPGCSKTMFGKAIFTSITATCAAKGAKASQGFILVSGPEILDKYVGVPEATIRHIFARARKFFQKTGIRPVIFLDEAESILAKRDSGISSDVLRTIVPAFLAEMQGVRQSGAIVILATNKPESLDYAAIREGRIDVKLRIGRPDRKAAREIFLKNMKDVPVSETTTKEKLADTFADELFSPKRVIYEIQRELAGGREHDRLFHAGGHRQRGDGAGRGGRSQTTGAWRGNSPSRRPPRGFVPKMSSPPSKASIGRASLPIMRRRCVISPMTSWIASAA
jgi:SpoVK/Ycf46/Vps4 family AAA+-type ATPase